MPGGVITKKSRVRPETFRLMRFSKEDFKMLYHPIITTVAKYGLKIIIDIGT
jgi:hypothetical protein